MDFSKIDVNFKTNAVTRTDVKWLNPLDQPFSMHGVYYSESNGKYVRLPEQIAKATNEGTHFLYANTAGGRIRFKTNSPFIAIKCYTISTGIEYHLTILAKYGFSVYVNGKYLQKVTPASVHIPTEGEFEFDGLCNAKPVTNGVYDVEIYMPLYNDVLKFFIGVQDDAKVYKADEYKYTKPVVYYGSSITQGGCATRPGNDYQSHVERWLNSDFINLGFSGNAKGEQVMAKYISTLDASVFVLDYDHNAPTPEHLEKTHYDFYKTIRTANPDTPIVLISKPDYYSCCYYVTEQEQNVMRREIIIESYKKAVKSGDKNVYFIDGKTLFGEKDYDACTVDGCHPNDLGFYRMAEKIYPVIKSILENK